MSLASRVLKHRQKANGGDEIIAGVHGASAAQHHGVVIENEASSRVSDKNAALQGAQRGRQPLHIDLQQRSVAPMSSSCDGLGDGRLDEHGRAEHCSCFGQQLGPLAFSAALEVSSMKIHRRINRLTEVVEGVQLKGKRGIGCSYGQ
jgi:hypothetical protein